MEFRIEKNNIKENIEVAIIRIAGYFKLPSNAPKSELNFIKPLSLAGYPRFHIYLKETKTEHIFSLHLDQKKPVYKGAVAHAGEYEKDNEILKTESERIIKKITP
jgi:hypothetical protein